MEQFTGVSLKTRLFLLVLAAFIPVTILIVYVAEEQKEIETDAILHKTTLMAQSAAEAENLQMEATRTLMAALNEAYLLADGAPDRLSRFLANLHSGAEAYVLFGILDPSGQLIAGSRPSSMTSDYSDRTWLAACLKQQRLTVGPYHGERIESVPVLYIAQPISTAQQKIAAVAFTALDLNRMNRSLFKQLTELPPGSRLTLMDDDQVLLRYSVDTAQWSTAQPFDPALRQKIGSRPSGVLVATDDEGISRIYAFAYLESAFQPRRVAVILEIPRSVALAATERILRRNLALLAVSALTAVLSIWWAANILILRRVDAMVRTSRRLAAGDLTARIGPMRIQDELSHLAGVFDEMAGALQMRIERETQVMASLKQSREQLRRLSAYQSDVREQERIRMAREIHDQMGQSLTILKMDISWLQRHCPFSNAQLEEKMTTMRQVIEGALENLHAVTAELRPVILDDFGLAAAIEWQVDRFSQRTGIGCRLENDGYEPDLPKAEATALFRIFQETLTNILRHAQADQVVVRLERRKRELFFEVADNGRGITEDEVHAPDAFGLLGIRERLYPFGGRVTFSGRPDQGTRVAIHLPLHQIGGHP
ncbi:MAG: histidine kinase [Desulfosarcinaceae bacterium]|jgi:signal transduction histidine kinase